MLRRLIIIAAVICIPLGVYVASTYGTLTEVTFAQAAATAESATEGDQAPKVLVRITIVNPLDTDQEDGGEQAPILARDAAGKEFHLSYTGSAPAAPFSAGQELRFVGHVHGGLTGYFHATQVYQ